MQSYMKVTYTILNRVFSHTYSKAYASFWYSLNTLFFYSMIDMWDVGQLQRIYVRATN